MVQVLQAQYVRISRREFRLVDENPGIACKRGRNNIGIRTGAAVYRSAGFSCINSIKKISAYNKDIIIYPGHGENTKLGTEIEKLIRLI